MQKHDASRRSSAPGSWPSLVSSVLRGIWKAESVRSPSDSVLAITLLCLSALGYTLNDTLTKFLIERYNVPTIIFIRSVTALPLIAVMAVVIGGDRVRSPITTWP